MSLQAVPTKIDESDQAILADMKEKLDYFLKKYEGFGLGIMSVFFHHNGQIQTQTRLELIKVQAQPK